MLLAIDIGNTNTSLALFAGADLVRSWRISTGRTTADEMYLKINGLLGEQAERVIGVVGCSTVPAALNELRTMLTRHYPTLPSTIVGAGSTAGVSLAVDNPDEVGSDRVANTLAAHRLFGGPTIVVDFGTSTNFDVVNVDGEFIGGVLAPGIQISMDALATFAAQLRKVDLKRPRAVIGRNTVECLQSGVVYGFASQVDGVVGRIVDELGQTPRAVVATGGLAPVVLAECRTVTHHEPYLTLIGLREAFDRAYATPSV